MNRKTMAAVLTGAFSDITVHFEPRDVFAPRP